jgi:hypothetical protein
MDEPPNGLPQIVVLMQSTTDVVNRAKLDTLVGCVAKLIWLQIVIDCDGAKLLIYIPYHHHHDDHHNETCKSNDWDKRVFWKSKSTRHLDQDGRASS